MKFGHYWLKFDPQSIFLHSFSLIIIVVYLNEDDGPWVQGWGHYNAQNGPKKGPKMAKKWRKMLKMPNYNFPLLLML